MCDHRSVRRPVRVGDAAVALQDPVIATGFRGWPPVDLGDDPPQHWRALDLRDGRIFGQACSKPVHLVRLDVDHEERGRALRQVSRDRVPEIGVDLADRGQHGEAQAQ